MTLINLIVGDWSYDGHNQTAIITIESNLSVKKIKSAYKAGTKQIGTDLSEHVCCEYQDNLVPGEIVAKLTEAGFKYDWSEDEYDEEDNEYCIDPDLFAEMYLFIVKLGNPEFEYKLQVLDRIPIGGYGLFSD